MLPSIFGGNLFDEFFDDSFDRAFFGGRNPLYGKREKNLMKTDVREVECPVSSWCIHDFLRSYWLDRGEWYMGIL